MSRTVNAAVVEQAGGEFRRFELELEHPRPDELMVALDYSGVCHTDLLCRDGGLPIPFPTVLGHEGTGIVEIVGSDVTGIAVGDRVILSPDHCGTCRNCLRGQPYCCLDFWGHNFVAQRTDGSVAFSRDGEPVHSHFLGQSSFASHVVVRATSAIRVQTDMPPELLAPLGCSVLTGAGAVLNVQRPDTEDVLVVFGLGAVGLSAVMAARISKLETVVAVDPVPARRELAQSLGASHALDPGSVDVAVEIQRITTVGAQFVLEASGALGALRQAVACLAPGGECTVVGAPPAGTMLPVDVQMLIALHQSIRGIALGGSEARTHVPQLIRHWENGTLPVERLVTVLPAEQINDAVADSLAGKIIKPVLRY